MQNLNIPFPGAGWFWSFLLGGFLESKSTIFLAIPALTREKKLLGEVNHFQTLSVMQPFDWLVQFQLEHFASGTVDVRNPMFVSTG